MYNPVEVYRLRSDVKVQVRRVSCAAGFYLLSKSCAAPITDLGAHSHLTPHLRPCTWAKGLLGQYLLPRIADYLITVDPLCAIIE